MRESNMTICVSFYFVLNLNVVVDSVVLSACVVSPFAGAQAAGRARRGVGGRGRHLHLRPQQRKSVAEHLLHQHKDTMPNKDTKRTFSVFSGCRR